MNYELKDDAKFTQTFGGEGTFDDWEIDSYGFQIGDLTVHDLKGVELAKFVCSAMNHLMINGHRFEFVKTGEIDLPLKVQRKV